MEHLPVKTTLRIALVGDYNPNVIAHQAIPLAIDDAAAVLDLTADYDWLATTELTALKIWWATMPSGWFLPAPIKTRGRLYRRALRP
jgi:CTP synthase (UTP-ammonia lyase)